jgi:hypothetical protein
MGVPVREEIIKTNCRGCHGGCGVLVHVRDGTIVKLEGNPDFPTNHGYMCSKGLAFQQLYIIRIESSILSSEPARKEKGSGSAFRGMRLSRPLSTS